MYQFRKFEILEELEHLNEAIIFLFKIFALLLIVAVVIAVTTGITWAVLVALGLLLLGFILIFNEKRKLKRELKRYI